MKSIILLAVVCPVVGCSSAVEVEPTEETAQASTAYLASNSSVTLPSTGFCHPINFWGAGAHSGARVMSWGVPASGGWSVQTGGAAHAFPYNTSSGLFVGNYECHDWSEITQKSSTPGVDAPKGLGWAETSNTVSVTGSVAMSGWSNNSPCWLDGVGHLSVPGERAWMSLVAGTWTLNAEGFPALFAQARCAWLGRAVQPPSILTATPGVSPTEAFGPSAGTCFLTEVVGNVDDGFAGWRKQTPWKLEVTAGLRARGYCVRY